MEYLVLVPFFNFTFENGTNIISIFSRNYINIDYSLNEYVMYIKLNNNKNRKYILIFSKMKDSFGKSIYPINSFGQCIIFLYFFKLLNCIYISKILIIIF